MKKVIKSHKYYLTPRGTYARKIWSYRSYWVITFTLLAVISLWLYANLGQSEWLALAFAICGVIAGVLILGCFTAFVCHSVKSGGVLKLIYCHHVAGKIVRALLSTMALDRRRDTRKFITSPVVAVTKSPARLKIVVEKLAGMHDLDGLSEDISAVLGGGYAVVSDRVSPDGSKFVFYAEDVSQNLAFVPRSIKDLKQRPYMLTLQKGLEINLASSPHISCYGASGSGKTTFLLSLIAQLFGSGSKVYFLDGKTEFYSFSSFYPRERMAEDSEEAIKILHEITEIITQRQKIMAEAIQRRARLGLRGYDVGLKSVVVVADEVGSMVASMDSKTKKKFVADLTQLVQKGRSVSVFLVMATQSPNADILPTSIRAQFSTRILLGSFAPETARMVFNGQSLDVGEPEKFTGYYISDGVTAQPQRFFVPNLYEHNLSSINTFKALYKTGLARD